MSTTLYTKPVGVDQTVTEEGAYSKFSFEIAGEFRSVVWCSAHDSKGTTAEVTCDLATFAEDFGIPCEFTDKWIEL